MFNKVEDIYIVVTSLFNFSGDCFKFLKAFPILFCKRDMDIKVQHIES